MSRRLLLGAFALLAGAAAAAASFAGAPHPVPDLIVLGAGLVVAEQFELRPPGRAPLPLSFAVIVVLVRAADPTEFALVVTSAFALAVALRVEPRGLTARASLYGERLLEAGASIAAFRLVVGGGDEGKVIVLLGLAAAAVMPIALSDVFTFVRERRIAAVRARSADLALVTSGMLMAVGYGGLEGVGGLGLWGPLLFSIPLVAAWYSFELLASTRRNLHQTVEALGTAPELAGLVGPGHAQRVAEMAKELGHELELPEAEIAQLETAALLHHLGAVCLDAPEPGEQPDPVAVAEAGASMLRASDVLAPAGDIVASEPLLHRAPGTARSTDASLAGQVLKVASAFDELTDGHDEHAAWALEALYTGPLYVYDGRVVGALERVLERRGVLPAPD